MAFFLSTNCILGQEFKINEKIYQEVKDSLLSNLEKSNFKSSTIKNIHSGNIKSLNYLPIHNCIDFAVKIEMN